MTAAAERDPSRLAELRAKIDAIDESVHRLLMQRAMVIDELIEVKGTARNGAAFRPGREADMMRRLARRHEGHLPITAVEHLWREIISTFTALQAPFEVAVSKGDDSVAAVEVARFTFGFTVPLLALDTAGEVVAWMEEGGDRLGVVLIDEEAGPWWDGLKSAQIVSRLPFLDTPLREAAAPALVLAPPLADPVPFEIGCFVASGSREAVARFIAAAAPDIIGADHAGSRASILFASTSQTESAPCADLDIRAVGGYAAPFRPGA
ncbi:MAG: chorismate mutase [Rhizobiaceae bacterium]|nr:chorismate mutase [Rhizobiaceae bacterium]